MGQGMVSADHILPKEYTDGLRLLQDRALRRQRNEVSKNRISTVRIISVFFRLVN
jgi:predicted unusual protein kinase regulating ubiquinone biosynthesis (AarF/ABC1/UbiB family)